MKHGGRISAKKSLLKIDNSVKNNMKRGRNSTLCLPVRKRGRCSSRCKVKPTGLSPRDPSAWTRWVNTVKCRKTQITPRFAPSWWTESSTSPMKHMFTSRNLIQKRSIIETGMNGCNYLRMTSQSQEFMRNWHPWWLKRPEARVSKRNRRNLTNQTRSLTNSNSLTTSRTWASGQPNLCLKTSRSSMKSWIHPSKRTQRRRGSSQPKEQEAIQPRDSKRVTLRCQMFQKITSC